VYFQVPSTREANSYVEEEMASTFREGKSDDTHFCQGKIRKTLQKIKKIQAGRMKTKLRIAFENLVKLKSSKRNGSLKTREDIIVFKIVVFAKSFTFFLFFSAEIFALQRHSGAKKKKKFGSDC